MEIYRSTVCPFCGKDLKICKSCSFYSPGVHWDCAETIDDPVYDKETRNFCSYFKFKEAKSTNPETGKKQEARSNFDKLFGE